MDRWEIEHSIFLSHYKEKMFGTLMGRLDKTISFTLLLSGSAVFADLGNNKFFGILVACLSALSFIGEFGKKSANAIKHSKEYHDLMIQRDKYKDDESLEKAFVELNKNDSMVWSSLSVAARNRTYLALYGVAKAPTKERYSIFEAIVSWLAGDKP
ncbi:hypothetical protein ACJ8LH_13040 [Serratia sp. CY49633]|uniref:hypothetical protein n=1 Tax=Serratia TaxID=613 RepID=UPI000CE2A2FC|nr:hypothetical protein [Serratia marcescens]AVD64567.1 hypothetical protein C4B62_15760 [Serratia marcescens]ELL0334879.1 hypothetical protein [Serratia marcescens]MBH2550699.1 hypothetical protein [Serratia marcescens]MBH2859124.1 hypothetical protein [Serratia marcescens]MBH2994866.1 hypothetical protein [Serratia marcescens]